MATNTQQPSRNLVDSQILASLFGLTTRRIQQLASEGVIPSIREKGGVNKYDLLAAIRGYVVFLQRRVESQMQGGIDDTVNESRKLRADADLKDVKARIAEMELDELQAKMHDAEDVQKMTEDLILVIREKLEALPKKLARKLTTVSSPVEVSEIIRKEVCEALLELSQYSYSEEAAKRRLCKIAGK